MESQFWKGLDKKFKTLFCVGLAGSFFILAVFFDLYFLFIVGSIFDWFPLIAGWMREKKSLSKKKILYIHKGATLLAYFFLEFFGFYIIIIFAVFCF